MYVLKFVSITVRVTLLLLIYGLFVAFYAPPIITELLKYPNGDFSSFIFVIGLYIPIYEVGMYYKRKVDGLEKERKL